MNKAAGVSQALLGLETGSCCCCSCCSAKQLSCSPTDSIFILTSASLLPFCLKGPITAVASLQFGQWSPPTTPTNKLISMHSSRHQALVLQGFPELPWNPCSLFSPVLLPLCQFTFSSSTPAKGHLCLLCSLHPTPALAKAHWSILGWQGPQTLKKTCQKAGTLEKGRCIKTAHQELWKEPHSRYPAYTARVLHYLDLYHMPMVCHKKKKKKKKATKTRQASLLLALGRVEMLLAQRLPFKPLRDAASLPKTFPKLIVKGNCFSSPTHAWVPLRNQSQVMA